MTADIIWTCDACRDPIRGVGFLHVQPWRVLEDAENPDTWQAHHRACMPDGTVDEEGYILGYTIDTGQVSTRAGLAQWTQHLAEKTWYELGQWREMVQRSTGIDVARDAARARIWSVEGGRTDEAGIESETGTVEAG